MINDKIFSTQKKKKSENCSIDFWVATMSQYFVEAPGVFTSLSHLEIEIYYFFNEMDGIIRFLVLAQIVFSI